MVAPGPGSRKWLARALALRRAVAGRGDAVLRVGGRAVGQGDELSRPQAAGQGPAAEGVAMRGGNRPLDHPDILRLAPAALRDGLKLDALAGEWLHRHGQGADRRQGVDRDMAGQGGDHVPVVLDRLPRLGREEGLEPDDILEAAHLDRQRLGQVGHRALDLAAQNAGIADRPRRIEIPRPADEGQGPRRRRQMVRMPDRQPPVAGSSHIDPLSRASSARACRSMRAGGKTSPSKAAPTRLLHVCAARPARSSPSGRGPPDARGRRRGRPGCGARS
jgi:hypothetical protein